ncbi:unnamed protein product [Peniophora sp. CBMAI 1063]|nr:unnamed protein product [Peniophora sp. CBMAI 1063]
MASGSFNSSGDIFGNASSGAKTPTPRAKGYKRLKLGDTTHSSTGAFHGLLDRNIKGSSISFSDSAPKATPAPALLTSALGTVSEEDVEKALSQQFMGVVPSSKNQHARHAPSARDMDESAAAPDNGPLTDDTLETQPAGDSLADAEGDDERDVEERRRKLETDFPILAWLRWDEVFLREIIRFEGRGDALTMNFCPLCGSPGRPEYSCEQCSSVAMCRKCVVQWHRLQPLHKIFTHEHGYRQRVEPGDLGLRIQLLHPPGQACRGRELAHVDHFTILHTTGVFRIRVDFCACEEGQDIPRVVQLLRRGLWPSTVENPQSATSFEALDDFTRLSNLGRLTGYDYHRAAAAKTDGVDLKDVPDIRKAFMTCVHEFRHITMFKRAGRGHEPGGIAATPNGACVVRCPACPDKSMNMRPGWESDPNTWLHRAVYSLDANFRLSNRLSRSTDKSDPYLNDGKAYMPPAQDYYDHLVQMEGADFEKPSECSRFGAINQANMKGGRGLRTTGMAACTCRHEFWQPNGITTLRKGERYISVDYALCGALKHSRAPFVLVTYDIACQWHKNLKARLEQIPEKREVYAGAMAMVEFILADKARFCVPKFHLYAHRLLCQINYAIGWTIGTGVLDGEGPERCWSGTNGAASSLREMGPGTMHDTMDDICGAWNWMKVCGIGTALEERMWRALWEGRVQSAIFTEFTDALRSEDPEKVDECERNAIGWELEPKKFKNPYNIVRKTATIKQIQLETVLAQGNATSKVAEQTGISGVNAFGTSSSAQGAEMASEAVKSLRSTGKTRRAKNAVPPATEASRASNKRKAPEKDDNEYVLPAAITVAPDAEDEAENEEVPDDYLDSVGLDADEATTRGQAIAERGNYGAFMSLSDHHISFSACKPARTR